MKRTDDELVSGFPKSKVTQVYLSFSTDGLFTLPPSSSTEACLSAGKRRITSTGKLEVILILNIVNRLGQTRGGGSRFGEL
jgi:hypothetical protein